MYFASAGDHAPVAFTTRRARTSPRGVDTT
jgi:hypothetical protein